VAVENGKPRTSWHDYQEALARGETLPVGKHTSQTAF
jgi:hypothetical protein